MKPTNNGGGDVLALLVMAVCAFILLNPKPEAEPRPRPVEPDQAPTALFEDVRVELPPDVFGVLKTLIESGRIEHGRVGLNGSKLERIEFANGRARFVPPLRLEYDGPGPLNAGTTIETIAATADGALLIDVRNSPIDIRINQTNEIEVE